MAATKKQVPTKIVGDDETVNAEDVKAGDGNEVGPGKEDVKAEDVKDEDVKTDDVKATTKPAVRKPAAPGKPAAKPVWSVVESLSDKEMKIEAANIFAYQRSAMLARVRVKGKLTGQVIVLDRMQYTESDGKITSR